MILRMKNLGVMENQYIEVGLPKGGGGAWTVCWFKEGLGKKEGGGAFDGGGGWYHNAQKAF